MYKYFFFDFDGMLADTYPHTATCLVKALEELRHQKINYNEAYDSLKICYAEAFAHFKMTEEEITLFKKYADDLSIPPFGTVYLPIPKLLQTIIDCGGTNFIYTNRNDLVFDYLDKFNIKHYFKDFIIAGTGFPYKPDPAPLNHFVEKYNLDKKECLVLGDRALDVAGAYNAGIDGLLYDVDSRVFAHRATYVVKHINEIYNYLPLTYHQLNNYHTHTSRCGHAVGNDEEYVIEAIKAGYQTLGFSDHFMFPDIKRNYEYFDSIRLLKEKYKDQINIKVALEVEYIPQYMDLYKKFKDNGDVDYLIFGNHGLLKENGQTRSDFIKFIEPFDDDNYLNMYYDALCKAVDSRLFKYICHPDCFLKGYGKWDDKAIALTHKIAKLLKTNNLYAELSCSGVRARNKMEYNGQIVPAYPFKEFFRILKEYDLKFVVGCDAHSPLQLDDDALQFVMDMAKELKLDLVYELNDL